MNSKVPLFILLVLTLLIGCQREKAVDFNTDIKPIINKKCISCHGGVKKNGGFSFLFESEALGNTEEGSPAIIPGNSQKSRLIQRLKEKDLDLRMPFEKPALSEEELNLFTKWIDQGAKWGTHWAYITPKKEELPKIKNDSIQHFIKSPIDQFIASKMEVQRLSPNTPAQKNILARRVAFDITGLPPEERHFNAFMEDEISYENFIDSLLNQKTYGEKWASWWLDLARYADTKGYEADRGRSIWQYRDWVINALNTNLSFDQFTIDQLAGDLLPNPKAANLIATAFHRNTMTNDEGGTSNEEFRTAAVIDRVNTTFDVWQSTTMSCVQCHSHPYDPIHHDEYYKMMAFFNNTRDEDTTDEEPNLRTYNAEDTKSITDLLEWIALYGDDITKKSYEDFLNFNEPKYHLQACENVSNGTLITDGKRLGLWNKGSAYLRNVDTRGGTRLILEFNYPKSGSQITIRNGGPSGSILSQFKLPTTNSKNGNYGEIISVPFKALNTKVDLYIEAQNNSLSKPREYIGILNWVAFLPELPGKTKIKYPAIEKSFTTLINSKTTLTPILVENPSFMKRETRFFERGNWQMPLDTVASDVPSILNDWDMEWDKNRLGLAKWLVSDANPLTSRTVVNRIWYQIFGRGIVSTIEDMGTQSEPPTHPALLDWMAVHFMEDQQWDLKALIKSIVMTATYQQSSAIDEYKYRLDPNNIFYSRGPKLRLQAEEIRDQALAVSGLLSPKMGGMGVMPPQPDGIWEHRYLGNLWKESIGEDRYRRAIYTYLKRTSPYPSLLTFDAGSREVCLVQRLPTNTPLQALVTLNDPVFLEAAFHLAKSEMTASDIDGAIRSIYYKATYSEIKSESLEVLRNLYQAALMEFTENPEALEQFLDIKSTTLHHAALTMVANAIMNLDEFLTHA